MELHTIASCNKMRKTPCRPQKNQFQKGLVLPRYPLKQSLVYRDKETYLGNIHFVIFSQLLLYRDNGVDKIELYKEIWPQDKEYQFNKLDTHLTNLKNHLKEKLNFDLLFSTRSGLIYIRVN